MSKWSQLDAALAKKRAEQAAAEKAEQAALAAEAPIDPATLPASVKSSSRNCFGIKYFETEEDADLYARFIRQRGDTYNGGYMHGVRCGRDTGFDHVDKETGKKLYAVTTR